VRGLSFTVIVIVLMGASCGVLLAGLAWRDSEIKGKGELEESRRGTWHLLIISLSVLSHTWMFCLFFPTVLHIPAWRSVHFMPAIKQLTVDGHGRQSGWRWHCRCGYRRLDRSSHLSASLFLCPCTSLSLSLSLSVLLWPHVDVQ